MQNSRFIAIGNSMPALFAWAFSSVWITVTSNL